MDENQMSTKQLDLGSFEAQASEVASILRALANERRLDDPVQAG